jgi:hypothetical protein
MRVAGKAPCPSRAATAIAALIALIVIPVGMDRVWRLFSDESVPVVDAVADAVSPLLIVNSYGLFAAMTTTRREIEVEGSDDGQHWREYAFRYKPDAISRRPPWIIPHQPRLDWQMWFAALGGNREQPWLHNFLQRLLEGSPQVVSLLAANPFPDHPPKYVRAVLYEYRFADARTRAATGQWWMRRKLGGISPGVSRSDDRL